MKPVECSTDLYNTTFKEQNTTGGTAKRGTITNLLEGQFSWSRVNGLTFFRFALTDWFRNKHKFSLLHSYPLWIGISICPAIQTGEWLFFQGSIGSSLLSNFANRDTCSTGCFEVDANRFVIETQSWQFQITLALGAYTIIT